MALARMEEVMLQHDRKLSEEAVSELKHLYLIWRAGHDRLCQEALSKSQCRWAIRPKHHFTEHVFLDMSRFQNPRYTSNYVNEDMVRRVKYLAAKSHAAHLSSHVAFKYALQVCMQWRV